MTGTDELDRKIIDLLTTNSRESITQLAAALGVSRATVQERIRRLEKSRVIQSYTININPDYQRNLVSAHAMIAVDPKRNREVCNQLKKIPAIKSLYSVNGDYDVIAMLQEPTTEELDVQLEEIGCMEGVTRTSTLILLSKLL
ncbi:Lrp/AsnC family transcriptional regulator [Dasania sp. GY-MA-18]|uniref:Lrp/AsnC family transcriptional regulator n=1 Tax=Dasania phycosphaerae TaxID=2950436 RepID=A0A9J6RLK4_9GAMM|nr:MULTISPECIES: Lrp/AsnC family transcriptional regulator [Dasania]MCR8922956.1 Lrp/AsnC family transcriptional regulator [Dasania sp. GY-MA-18]MCZ0865387.1 Lrp/AsnC family transcriptional regulator [Dasania phycosphaerae]MCZ0869112.1 Lrp/AsnC family transcriptional regulator [Dasania phycosphaerae]